MLQKMSLTGSTSSETLTSESGSAGTDIFQLQSNATPEDDYFPEITFSNLTDSFLQNTTAKFSLARKPQLRSISPEIQDIYQVCTFVIPFLAFVFNGLSIAVFLQRRLSKAAVSTFLIALAVFDTMAVTMIFYTSYIRLGWWPISNLGCKISVYITAVGRMCAVWLVVFFTAERLISVKYVLRKAEIITPLRVRASIGLLFCAMLVEQAFVLVWVEAVPPEYCFNRNREIQQKYFLTLVVLNRVFNFLVPLLLVAVMNSLIVHSIRRSSSKLEGKTSKKENNSRRLTVMLVLVSTVSFILLIPETTAKIMEIVETFDPIWLTSFTLMSDVISYLSHCCNFFFYVISGKQFRKDFIDMICCVKCRTKGMARSHSSSVNSSPPSKVKVSESSNWSCISTDTAARNKPSIDAEDTNDINEPRGANV